MVPPIKLFAKADARHAYSGVIFLGAFLLFSLQPMMGKFLLPYFGGASSVWAVVLLFFTVMLSVAYAYAYVLTRRAPMVARRVHLGLIYGAASIVLLYALAGGPHAFFTGLIVSAAPPAMLVLIALLCTVGVPYLLLASTSPLVQVWFTEKFKEEPYRLYSVSNLGSFAALAAFVFVVEPLVPLNVQYLVWSCAFFFYAAAVRALMPRGGVRTGVPAAQSISPHAVSSWLVLSALPAFVLIAATTHITQVVAPMPLLWIVPLALYLLSYVVAFSGRAGSDLLPALLIVFGVVSYLMLVFADGYIAAQACVYLGLLFVAGLTCHGALYTLRPRATDSSLFYLFVSLGGAVGSLCASVLPPLIFNDLWEFPLGIVLSTMAGILLLPRAFYPSELRPKGRVLAAGLLLLVVLDVAVTHVRGAARDDVQATRNFYGVAKVVEDTDVRALRHGSTLHGLQFPRGSEFEFTPTTYYAVESGVGRSLLYAHFAYPEKPVTVGVVGLGSGTLAAYCSSRDSFTFFEIDSRIATIAREAFTYLSRCPKAEILFGDGRLLLAARDTHAPAFDVLVVDAFSDDSIPVHLLTTEAIRTYLRHVREGDGILAIHTSNRYLDLAKVVAAHKEALGLSGVLISSSSDTERGVSGAEWVLLSRDANVFNSPLFDSVKEPLVSGGVRPWTDTYASVLSVIDIPDIRSVRGLFVGE